VLTRRKNNSHSWYWPIGITLNLLHVIQTIKQSGIHYITKSITSIKPTPEILCYFLVIVPLINGTLKSLQQIHKFRPNLTVQQRVLRAGKNCYGTMRKLFIEAGYEQILMTVGDHELGGNSWRPNSTKVNSLDEYRQGFAEGFNKISKTGVFRFRNPLLV